MGARFRVNESFAVTTRMAFVLSGVVLDGEVCAGQYVRAPFHVHAPVTAVEFVLRTDYREEPALVFQYRNEGELARWQALNWAGQVIELGETPVGDGAVDRDV